MLSRLLISLAQLKAGNNSGKLKNEIKQLLYFLYRSKNLTKAIYNQSIKIFMNNKIIRQLSVTNFFMNLLTSLILKIQIKYCTG